MTTTIVFQGDSKLIEIYEDVETSITVDVQKDIYSAWKTWVKTNDNAKYLFAMRTVGGDPTVGVKSIAPSFFLMNGWKIKPVINIDTIINLEGNLFVDDIETYGGNIAVPPDGYYTVQLNLSTTSDAIQVISGSGVTQQDKEDIADLVEVQTGQPIKIQTTNIERHHISHKKIEGDYINYYDGETLVFKYKMVKDSQERIIELIPEEVL